jgi:AcrR family transcriptional regulator
MIHPIKRDRKRQVRREFLVDAAMKIVAERGLDGLTMAHLADEVGASIGSTYRYFPGKAELVAALQAEAIARFAAHLRSELGPPGAPLERVARAHLAYLTFADAAPEVFALIDASLSEPRRVLDDAAAAAVEASLEPVLAVCAATIDDAVAAGALRPGDAVVRTHALWAALHGVSHFRKRDGRSAVSSWRLAEEVVGAMLAGWGA